MNTVTISPKFQVVIPKEVRDLLHFKSGQKVTLIVKRGIVHMVPVEPLKALEGFVKGIDTSNMRDEEDRY